VNEVDKEIKEKQCEINKLRGDYRDSQIASNKIRLDIARAKGELKILKTRKEEIDGEIFYLIDADAECIKVLKMGTKDFLSRIRIDDQQIVDSDTLDEVVKLHTG